MRYVLIYGAIGGAVAIAAITASIAVKSLNHLQSEWFGYLVMLVANRVPYLAKHEITLAERQTWNTHRAQLITQALSGIDVKEALMYVRHLAWQWNAEVAPANVPIVGIPMR